MVPFVHEGRGGEMDRKQEGHSPGQLRPMGSGQKASRVLKELEDIDTGFASAHQRPRGRLRIDIGSANASCVLIPHCPTSLRDIPTYVSIWARATDKSISLART